MVDPSKGIPNVYIWTHSYSQRRAVVFIPHSLPSRLDSVLMVMVWKQGKDVIKKHAKGALRRLSIFLSIIIAKCAGSLRNRACMSCLS